MDNFKLKKKCVKKQQENGTLKISVIHEPLLIPHISHIILIKINTT